MNGKEHIKKNQTNKPKHNKNLPESVISMFIILKH